MVQCKDMLLSEATECCSVPVFVHDCWSRYSFYLNHLLDVTHVHSTSNLARPCSQNVIH